MQCRVRDERMRSHSHPFTNQYAERCECGVWNRRFVCWFLCHMFNGAEEIPRSGFQIDAGNYCWGAMF